MKHRRPLTLLAHDRRTVGCQSCALRDTTECRRQCDMNIDNKYSTGNLCDVQAHDKFPAELYGIHARSYEPKT